ARVKRDAGRMCWRAAKAERWRSSRRRRRLDRGPPAACRRCAASTRRSGLTPGRGGRSAACTAAASTSWSPTALSGSCATASTRKNSRSSCRSTRWRKSDGLFGRGFPNRGEKLMIRSRRPPMSQATLTHRSLTERYEAEFPGSRKLHDQARTIFPNGVTHDLRHLEPFPVYIERAEGAHKWDVDGHRFVDFWSGHGALLLG